MSKETAVIGLGVWIIVATQLGIPLHPWLTIIFVLTGVAAAVIGFLLRGESLGRGQTASRARGGRDSHSYVESPLTPTNHEHDNKEGITSLN